VTQLLFLTISSLLRIYKDLLLVAYPVSVSCRSIFRLKITSYCWKCNFLYGIFMRKLWRNWILTLNIFGLVRPFSSDTTAFRNGTLKDIYNIVHHKPHIHINFKRFFLLLTCEISTGKRIVIIISFYCMLHMKSRLILLCFTITLEFLLKYCI